MTAIQFSLLSNSEEPFLCYACFQQDQRERVKGLEEKVAALTEKLTKLRSSRVAAAASTNCNEQWSKVVKRGKRGPRSGSGSLHRSTENTTCPPPQEDSSSSPQPSNNQDSTTTIAQTPPPLRNRRAESKRPCTAVLGARKVWGTLRSTTVSAVSNAIRSVTNIPTADISVKRKFKSRPDDNRIKRWWFVIRGEESTLQNLEGCWNQLELQTKWKLEPVLRFSDATASAESDQSKPLSTEAMPNESATDSEVASNVTMSTVSASPPQEVPITNEVPTLN